MRSYTCALALALTAGAASAEKIEYKFTLTLTHSSGFTKTCEATRLLETTWVTEPTGEENPLAIEGLDWVDSAAQAGPSSTLSIIGVHFDFDSISSLHAEGVVHRDIACRNILVDTTAGRFSSSPQELFTFGSDAPAKLRGNGNIGPVRWMAPESIRASSFDPGSTGGSAAPGEYWELAAFSYFDANYVPAPASVLVLAAAGLGARRRR